MVCSFTIGSKPSVFTVAKRDLICCLAKSSMAPFLDLLEFFIAISTNDSLFRIRSATKSTASSINLGLGLNCGFVKAANDCLIYDFKFVVKKFFKL